ncbi:MAG: nickel pincer cofactor biosynthesis protein LarC [Nitrosopumilaceae archaeon]|nr:nickel pincer cofactor biosynthesis protein LarC [Nitrosopumilaceae archaeon]NIU00521.1 nickel pincer cofactor biosynthesis protein LarC [Nitrosopumilaceae archaeon]NIU86904.1 nickel pincer cofactor biosynthesis protein LarC [Nitrosopumilaceae archaeon]NIV65584.1 nickel pincer cofactor biosynthesis protein LarC [Nitrosopumilaceae archaeon]NIX61123.1 nickel pincer cofactor biosynthesis protein LarC [Nitrosopumilaceae archaeon]
MVIVIDCQVAGISGDMLLSSLVGFGADKDRVIEGVKLSESFLTESKIEDIDFRKVKKSGIEATQLFLKVNENVDERKAVEIKNCIEKMCDSLKLSDNATKFALTSIENLMEAESKIHGESLESIHFHEAASIDTVIDIVGCAIALEDLSFFDQKIITTPVSVGGGTISFSHGTTSNPASAILEILKKTNIKICGGPVSDELTTPTGASMLVSLTNTCQEFYPKFKLDEISYGAGSKNFNEFANVLKIVKGTEESTFHSDNVTVLETNLDDVSSEIIGSLFEKLMDAGALDVSAYSGFTKKNRPNILVSVICKPDDMNTLLDILVSETRTLGVRIHSTHRRLVSREADSVRIVIKGKEFEVNLKKFQISDNWHYKIEFDDLKKISSALNIPIRDTEELIRKKIDKT